MPKTKRFLYLYGNIFVEIKTSNHHIPIEIGQKNTLQQLESLNELASLMPIRTKTTPLPPNEKKDRFFKGTLMKGKNIFH